MKERNIRTNSELITSTRSTNSACEIQNPRLPKGGGQQLGIRTLKRHCDLTPIYYSLIETHLKALKWETIMQASGILVLPENIFVFTPTTFP